MTFVATPDDWHIEFVATEPCEVVHEGVPAIRLRYVADAGGFAPFDARIRDVGTGGIGILVYSPDLMLEPGKG